MGRLKDLILAGAELLGRGVTDQAAWSERMLQEFGPCVTPFLKDVYANALELHGFDTEERSRDTRKKKGGLFMARQVLIVDDEPNIVLSLKFLMTQGGFEVRTARSGEEALAALAEQVPDLVLLDVMMPKPDGYEVCQKIRSTPEWRDTAVIMLTARGRDVEREKGLAMGADDYVTKPFATRELVAKVHAILNERKK